MDQSRPLINIDLQIRHLLMRMTFGGSKKQELASLYNQTKYRKLRYQKKSSFPFLFLLFTDIYVFQIKNSSSGSCGINEVDSTIITGGSGSRGRAVERYNEKV